MSRKQLNDDFKCNCSNPHCDLEEKLREKADILGVSLGSAAFFLNTLKSTATLTPIAGLKELAGGLLVVVTAIQDKNEVKGGFKHIIVDCLRVTCIVCEHARLRKNHISPVIKRAIDQLNHDLNGIREYAEKMNKRGLVHRTFMGSADKAEVNAWRQRLTTSWGVFTTELLMDTNYKVTPAKGQAPLNQADLVKQIVEQLVAKQGGQINHEPADYSAASRNASPQQRTEDTGPQWIERGQGDYQHPQNNPNPSGNSYATQGYEDPQSYYDEQTPQSHTPQQWHPRDDSRNPFRSQTSRPNPPNRRHPAPPPHVHSDPASPNPGYHEPQGYYPEDQYGYHNSGYGQWGPPPPHRYYTMPPQSTPVNNIGSVTNANFGVNHGTISQHSGW